MTTKKEIFDTLKKRARAQNVNIYLHMTKGEIHSGYAWEYQGRGADLKFTPEGKTIL